MKKLISVLMVLVMVVSLMFIMSFSSFTAPEHELGDVDGNGAINIMDYIAINLAIKDVNTIDNESFRAADINGDLMLTDVDAYHIRNHILGIVNINDLYKKGDVNGYGKINLTDYIAVNLHVLNITLLR